MWSTRRSSMRRDGTERNGIKSNMELEESGTREENEAAKVAKEKRKSQMSGLFPLASRAIQSMLLALSRLNSFCPRVVHEPDQTRSRSFLICISCDLTLSIWLKCVRGERGGCSIVSVCLCVCMLLLLVLSLLHGGFSRRVIQTLCTIAHTVTVYTTIKRAMAAYIHFYDIL